MEKKVTIVSETGLHARPAAIFVKAANDFQSQIEINHKGKSCNAKSIMSVMGMGLTKNTTVTLVATGPDEEMAIDTLGHLIENNFSN